MCGISGIISKTDKDFSDEVMRMCQRMILRGPDHQEVYHEGNVTLGHCRLSIIDLNTGNQPMKSADGKVVIVFNGEIYNFLNIKDELSGKGYGFSTRSDTEVIIAGYREWGIDGILQRLEGMFAFALYDKETKDVFIARDRFGEKPLYYKIDDYGVAFASELKAFAPDLKKYHIDIEAFNYYTTLSYIPSPLTIYREFRKLPQGHYMRVKRDLTVDIVEWYNLANHIANPVSDTYDQAKDRIRGLMRDSVKKRMIADVPTGAFLSGGVDSSIVCELMSEFSDKQFDTFSIGFKEKEYDESHRAQIVADKIGSRHHLHYLDFNDVVDKISDIIDYYDEPFSDSSALPSYYVAMLARKDVKVVLTGDSADEIFAGYEKYLGRYYASKYRALPSFVKSCIKILARNAPINRFTNAALRKVNKLINTAESSDFDIYYNLMSLAFPDYRRVSLLRDNVYRDVKTGIKKVYDGCPCQSPLNKEQYCDIRFVLEGDMFPKVDRACMHNSLENRTPILDTRLVEYSFRINPEYKLKGRNKKRILKDSFRDELPAQTTKFSKCGFGVPIDYWFRNELREEMAALIGKDLIESQGLYNYEYVWSLFEKHLSGEENNAFQLWNIYVFQKWYTKRI